MSQDKYDVLKLGNQLCFPLYACSREIIKKYKPCLDNLNLTNLCIDGAKVKAEERDRFQTLKPDCWITYDDAQPYNDGWRYTEENKPLPWYGMIRSIFRYDRDPNIPNNVGWYLPEDFEDVLASTPMPIVEEATEETVPAETIEETAPPE